MTPGLTEAGMSPNDFVEGPFRTFKRQVVRTPITKTTSNYSGAPTYTKGENVTIWAIFTKRTKEYDLKESLVEKGDAFMQILPDTELNKEDLITADNEVYRVDEVIMRAPAGENFFKSVRLFKFE